MTKKDYIKVAEILLRNRPVTDRLPGTRWYAITVELAKYFKEDNNNFDFDKFYLACGLTE